MRRTNYQIERGHASIQITAAVLLTLLAGVFLLAATGCTRETKVENHLEKARAYFEDGDLEEAAIEFENALRLQPENPEPVARLGEIYYLQGNLLKAYAFLDQAKKRVPEDLEARIKLGLTFQAMRQYSNARVEADYVLTRQPTNETALMLYADTVTSTNLLQETMERLDSLSAQAGSLPGYVLAQASLYAKQQNYAKTEELIRQAMAIDEDRPATLSAMGNLLVAQDKQAAAEPYLRRAAEASPWGSQRRLQYADYLLAYGDAEKGQAYLEKITQEANDFFPAWIRWARLEVEKKNFQEAEKIVRSVLAQDPQNFEALMVRGRMHLLQNQPDQAIEVFNRVNFAYEGSFPSVHYSLAGAYLMKDDTSMAMGALNQAIRLNPTYAEAVLLQSEILMRQGDHTAAILALNKLLQENPRVARAYTLLADAYARRGNVQDAFRVYEALRKLAPQSPEVPMLIGQLHMEQNNDEEARRAFGQAMTLNPGHLAAVEKLVDLDLKADDFAAAKQRVEEHVDRESKALAYWLFMGKIQMDEGNYDDAEASINKALAIQPDLRLGLVMLSQLYVDANKEEEALEKLRSLTEKNPEDKYAWFRIGLINGFLKNHQASADAYEQLLEVDPNYVPALNNLAYLYSTDLKDLDKALALARKAQEQSPNDPASADTLGWIHYLRGEYRQALSLLQTSANLLPNESEVLFHLGMTHYMLGNADEARSALQRSAAIPKEFAGREQIEPRLAILNMDPSNSDAEMIRQLEGTLAQRPQDPIVVDKLAAIYDSQGQTDKAVALYQYALQRNPRHATAATRLAFLYADKLNDPVKAMEMARRARELAPNDGRVAHLLGRLVYASGDYTWANSLFQESAMRLPQDASVQFAAAQSDLTVGRVEQALTRYRQALDIAGQGPQAETARQVVALLEYSQNPEAGALPAAALAAVQQANPKHVAAMYALARQMEKQGNHAEAKQAYESLLAAGNYPGFVQAHKRLAILMVEHLNQAGQALDHAMQARAAYPSDPEVAKALGIVEYERGDFNRAAQLLRESTAQLPQDGRAYFYLGMAYLNSQRPAEAQSALTRAVSLAPNASYVAEANQALAGLKE